METVVVAGLNGLVVGASLALVAAGLALLFGVFGILNLAQGGYFMLGGYVVWLAIDHGQNFWLGVAAAAAAVGIGGGVVLLAMIWPVRDRPTALVLLATLALSLVLEQLASDFFGGDTKAIGAPLVARLPIGHTEYPVYDLVIVGLTAAILAGGFMLLKYAKYGVWIRAVAQNRELASILGIPIIRVYVLAFMVSSSLAALAGSLLVPLTGAYPTVGVDVTVNAFIVVIAGGLGNLRGAAAVAFLLGVVEAVGSIWVRAQAVQLGVFVLVILLLIVRSQGRYVLVRA